MNRTKREVISVWPASSERKPYKALVKITFGESISLFPLSLMEGKHGYYLQFPKANRADGTRSLVGRFLYSDANRMLTEKVLRAYLPGTPLCREYQMNEKLHISFRVFPHSMQVDRQVAVASINCRFEELKANTPKQDDAVKVTISKEGIQQFRDTNCRRLKQDLVILIRCYGTVHLTAE